ncbi:sensor histidine kinase [Alteromonas sp. 1_MG-2023]|uniref:sensor histidine kinase n=1 Tax=Alteromonas sp. 1_MG-2023 TaxID=3062669 RepID=UPI0026E46639|nr:sensor histidine kinase [Alteromonas sp. 1_MG-2023]MDO6567340.1 sensor histidine kinase [Alteromonas sp. 1_MG-2023]
MSGFKKISSAIVAVFIVCFLVFSCSVYFQIRQNINDETSSALNQVQEMLKANMSASDIKAVAEQSPHLSVSRFTGRLSAPANFHSDNQPIYLPIHENQYLVVRAYDTAELVQNMNLFWLVAGLFFTTLSLLLFTLKVAVKQRLKPLNQLGDALQQLVDGKSTDKFEDSDIKEVKRVIGQFQRLQQSLQIKERQLVNTDKKLALLQEQERSYLAQELHDNVGQLLTTIKAHAYILVNSKEPSVLNLSANKVQVMSQQISDAIRHLTAHLHPLVLDRVSLQQSLERLVFEQELALPNTQWQVSINLNKYSEEHERDIHIYRFVQEAVNNVVKHAEASKVWVHIHGNEYELNISIRDNGQGFDAHVVESIGMSSMHSRARCIGASCSVKSQINEGVNVQLSLRLHEAGSLCQANVA